MQTYQGENPAFEGMTLYAYRMPGYPFILAVWYKLFGWKPINAMVLNLLAELCTGCMVFLIAYILFGKKTALIAQALWSVQILWVTSLMTEPVFTALLLCATAMLVMHKPFRSPVSALEYGILVAASVFVRPLGLASLGAVVLLHVRRIKKHMALLCLTMAILPTVIGIGAWTYRNYRIFGEMVPLSTNFGRHNAPDFGIDYEETYVEMRAKGENEAAINKALTQAVVEQVRTKPFKAASIYLKRIWDLFALPALSYVEQGLLWPQRFSAPETRRWVYSIYRSFYYQYHFVYSFALIGFAMLVRRREIWNGFFLTFVVSILWHALVSKGNLRFAAPLYPFLCIFAGVSLKLLLTYMATLFGRRQNCHGEPERSRG